jgi:hypothetical protein
MKHKLQLAAWVLGIAGYLAMAVIIVLHGGPA